MDFGTLSFAVSASVVILAALIDSRTRRIPNWLVGPYLLSGLILRWVLEGRGGLWDSLAALALALVPTIPLYLLGGLGLGDCKLLAAVGVWVGLYQTVFVLFGTALSGGLIALYYVSRKGLLFKSLQSTTALVTAWANGGLRTGHAVHLQSPHAVAIPYGPAIAVGVLFSFVYV